VNLIELPALMRQHSVRVPGPVSPESRITGVIRKVRLARRRRTAAGIAGVAAILAASPFVVSGGGQPVQPAATSTAIETVNGFPKYAAGGQLVATQTAPLDKSISLTITPTDLGLEFSDRCSVADQGLEVEITMALAGGSKLMVGCNASGGAYASEDSRADHLTPGVPTSLTFSAKAYRVTTGSNGEQTGRTPVAVAAGTYSIGVWQKLPFDQYPLPPRPKTLPTLNIAQYGLGEGASVKTVRSDPDNPLAQRTISFTMPACVKATTNCNPTAATSQTPGFLHIAVNGVAVNTAEFWDYSGGGSSFNIEPDMPNAPHLRAGDLVTITITPQFVTGAWEFAVAPGPQR
jgi:hypothetical protein